MISTPNTDTDLHRTGLDSWSPLALHIQDLAGAETQRQGLINVIREMQAGPTIESPARPAAWAGDRLGLVNLHHDPRMTWLCRSLASEAWSYLERLGHDIDDIELRVERAWPIVSAPGTSMAPHAHHDTHLTAVYYVEAPTGSGALRFVNSTRGQHADYVPVNGRLAIFPSRQRHEVLENLSDQDRLSISFEIVITRCKERCTCGRPDAHPSEQSRTLPRQEALSARRLPVGGMVTLDAIQRTMSPVDTDPEDVNVPVLAGLPPDTATWDRFRGALNELHEDLESLDIDITNTSVSLPSLSWRREGNQGLFGQAPTDLQIYMRMDDGDEECAIEYEDDPTPVRLASGALVIINGQRRHRVIGEGLLMRFGCDLPAALVDAPFEPDETLTLLNLDQGFMPVVGTRSGGNGHRRDLFPVR